MKRVFLAGVLGGIAMFIWSAIAHMLLPLGEVGVAEVPNEAAVLTTLRSNIGDQNGLYLFPGLGLGPNPTRAQQQEAMKQMDAKLAANPSGLLVYHPAGKKMMMGRWLTIEFVTELIEAILVVWLLGQTRITSFGGKVGFVFLAGIIAALTTNVSYWNWYGFPTNYTLAYMSTQVIGFLCVGLVAGLITKTRAA